MKAEIAVEIPSGLTYSQVQRKISLSRLATNTKSPHNLYVFAEYVGTIVCNESAYKVTKTMLEQMILVLSP